MKAWVDETKCRGHALCLRKAPELFGFDDLGDHAFVKDTSAATSSEELLRKAATECPERAIVVEAEPGEEIK